MAAEGHNQGDKANLRARRLSHAELCYADCNGNMSDAISP